MERAQRSRAPELDKKKYLVPSDLTGEIHKHAIKDKFYSLNLTSNPNLTEVHILRNKWSPRKFMM